MCRCKEHLEETAAKTIEQRIKERRNVFMKLNSYCVYHFRSIKESGWVECSNRTTLVGVNESGKTNML